MSKREENLEFKKLGDILIGLTRDRDKNQMLNIKAISNIREKMEKITEELYDYYYEEKDHYEFILENDISITTTELSQYYPYVLFSEETGDLAGFSRREVLDKATLIVKGFKE